MEEGNSESQEQDTHVEASHSEESNVAVAEENHEVHEETKVPISAMKKERRKRQEIQAELDALKSRQTRQSEPEEEDLSEFETVTKGDLGKSKFEILRDVREEAWAENFPDRAEYVNSELEDFIKQRPNLALALQGSPNRLKEAWELMNALAPKQDKQRSPVKKEVPASPGTVPKSAALNASVDVMNMSDKEFVEWRKAQKTRR